MVKGKHESDQNYRPNRALRKRLFVSLHPEGVEHLHKSFELF